MKSIRHYAKTMIMTMAAGAMVLGCGATEVEAQQAEAKQGRSSLIKGGHGCRMEKKARKLMKKLDLRADQSAAVERLLQDVRTKLAPARQLKARALQEAASQVRAGKVQRDRLEPLMKAAKAQRKEVKKVAVSAVTRLHQILDKSQREKLVGLIQKRHKRGHFRGHHHKMMRKWASKLNLTEAQQDQIEDLMMDNLLGKRSEMRKQMRKMRDQMKQAAEAFKSDRFDSSQLPIAGAGHGHQGMHELLLGVAEKALPLLMVEQRQVLADSLDLLVKAMSIRDGAH